MNLFNALGKVKISFTFMLVWTIATWILTPLFTRLFGMYGFPLVLLLVASSSLIVSSQAKRYVQFHFIESIYKGIASALLMGIAVVCVLRIDTRTFFTLPLAVAAGVATYVFALSYIFKINILKEIKSLSVTKQNP